MSRDAAVWVGAGLATALAACSPSAPRGPGPADAAVVKPIPPVRGRVVPIATAPAASRDLSWLEAVRMADWSQAEKRISELDAAVQQQAPMKYLMARVLSHRGKREAAIELLTGLESELPVVQQEILSERAALQLKVGPFLDAAQYYAGRAGAENSWRLGLAYHRAKKDDIALSTVNVALTRLGAKRSRKKHHDVTAKLRDLRAEILEGSGKPAGAGRDHLWILLHAPTHALAVGALERVERLWPTRKLSNAENYQLADAFAEAGRPQDTDAAIERMTPPVAGDATLADRARTRAWARYNGRQDYAGAAALFAQAADLEAKHRVQDRFYAARSLSRAEQDEQAITDYAQLAKSYPTSSYAERAIYLIARLHYIHGDFGPARDAYDVYLKRYGKKKGRRQRGRFEGVARYERASALYGAKQYAEADKALATEIGKLKDSHFKSLIRELRAAAQIAAGAESTGIAGLLRVLREHPMTLGASLARARLRRHKHELPPLIPASTPRNPGPLLDLHLPSKAQWLAQLGLDREAEAELRKNRDAIRERHPDRRGETMCRIYGQLGTADARYREGQQVVRSAALSRQPTARSRWAWECIYPRPFAEIVSAASGKYGLPKHYAYAIMRQESAFRPSVVSSAKAVGLMQMIPPTAKRVALALGVPYEASALTEPAYNVRFGAYYLDLVYRMFGDRVTLAAAAYNAGPNAVDTWMRKTEGMELDLWVARIPYLETRRYVTRVASNLARYTYLYDQGEREFELALPPYQPVPDDAY